MQILIKDCDNMPPEIEVETEYCVIAGETLEFDVIATAPILESDQLVNLTATGGPFELDLVRQLSTVFPFLILNHLPEPLPGKQNVSIFPHNIIPWYSALRIIFRCRLIMDYRILLFCLP